MSVPLQRTLGPYEIVRRLGGGGMGETFLAVRRGPGGSRALKFAEDASRQRAARPDEGEKGLRAA